MAEELPATLVLERGGPLHGTVAAPGSKSHTNRALALAALAGGESRLTGALRADDTMAMAEGLQVLGAEVGLEGDDFTVGGCDGRFGEGDRSRAGSLVIDARQSGTTLRFVTALATCSARPVTITGAATLLGRPLEPLATALRSLGCSVELPGGGEPVQVGPGRPGGGQVNLDASASSQFVSAVLLVSPYATGQVEISPTNLTAGGYAELTVSAMRRWGATVEATGQGWRVSSGQGYCPRVERIAGDASAAAHLFALAVTTGGEVTVTNLARAKDQPDMKILEVLTDLGVAWRWEDEDSVTVRGPERVEALRPIDVDLSAAPDLLPTVAVMSCLAFGRSRLRGIGVTRHHETDRVAAVTAELGRVGIKAEPEADGSDLVIEGGGPQGMVTIDPHGDHRMAMAFAALGARLPYLVLRDPACVAKTYPGWWDDAASLGLGWKNQVSFKGLKF